MIHKFTRRALALFITFVTLGMLVQISAYADGDQITASTTDGTGNSIVLMPEDASGNTVPAAGAKHKEAVRVLLPFKCVDDNVTELSICPVVGSVDTFPFQVTKQDYTKFFVDLYPNESGPRKQNVNDKSDPPYEFSFHFSIHDEASKGTKMVAFLVKYKIDGVDEEEVITIPVEVQDSPSGSSGVSSGGSGARLAPKVIIESFSFDQKELFAGDTFELAIDLINTSTREAVRNMTVAVTDATGVVMPANNGSNSQYIERIEISGSKKGNTKALIFPMQIAPDAEAKSILLTVAIAYNGASSKEEYESTETIAVPVRQKQRVRFGTPVVYDDAWVGQTVSVTTQMFNLGKSPLYNASVTVEGQGLAMEEEFFGGNIASGGTLRAEFNIIPSVGGDIEGTVVITYEDVYGNPTEHELPLKLFVNDVQPEIEAFNPEEELTIEEPPADTTVRIFGIPWYLIALLIIVLAVIVTLMILRAKKKRAKELSEL